MKRFIACLFLVVFGFNNPMVQAQSSIAIKMAPGAPSLPPAVATEIKLKDHPRLFFSKDEEAALFEKAKGNPLLFRIIGVLKLEAEKDLQLKPQQYLPNVQLLAISREQIRRVVTLAMAYRIFKDDKYAKKAEEELINVSNFPSWNPKHFLDVAEMTTAVAIGYDWCYDYLSEASRKLIETAIREKGFGPAWPLYQKTEKTPFNRENNWNMVCNSGLLNGAIAIGDKYPDELNRILGYAVQNTPKLLESFAPEGVFNEGPGYWGYNGMYMSLFFDNLQRNIQNEYGLTRYAGLDNTANFYSSLVGPTNRNFSFADASEGVDKSGTFFLLSKLYNQPEVAGFYRSQIDLALNEYEAKGSYNFPRFFFLSVPWFDEASSYATAKEEKLTVFKGVTDFLIFNAGKDSDKNRLWLAAKTGLPTWSHNQLDVGSFVLDCDGERWGIDLGADTYSLPSFWDYKPGGIRWNYFRNTNLAHNTISIDDKITNAAGQGELIRSNTISTTPFGIFDMSAGYSDEAGSVLRGFKLLSSDAILVRDEIRLKPGSKKVAWRFITDAEVNISGNTATLTKNNKKFFIQCLLGSGFTMKSFPAQTNTEGEKPISGVTIIEITVKSKERLVYIPVVMGRQIPKLQDTATAQLSIEKWK